MGDSENHYDQLSFGGFSSLSSNSESSIELKRKTAGDKNLIADYRDDAEETYESSSDDYFPSSFSSTSSSSPEPVVESKKQNPAKKPREIKTKGEMSLDELPRIEDLNITVPEEDLQYIGKTSAIVDRLVVVESEKNLPALNLESVLFLQSSKPLGKVFDTFGPVASPYYCVRFNSGEEIREKGIEIGSNVYFVPNDKSITSYVLVQDLTQEKGSDASWKNNNEPPVECIDYSDDEAERMARQMKKGRRMVSSNPSGEKQNKSVGNPFQKPQSTQHVREARYHGSYPKEQGFPRPATFTHHPSHGFSNASRQSMLSAQAQNLIGVNLFGNAGMRPQMLSQPLMANITNPTYPGNQVSPCMMNVTGLPPPVINIAGQPAVIALPNNVQNNFEYCAQPVSSVQQIVPSSGNTQIFGSRAISQSPAVKPQPFGQSSFTSMNQVVIPYQKPVFSAPPIFSPMLCVPPPPPPPVIPTSGASRVQVNFTAAYPNQIPAVNSPMFTSPPPSIPPRPFYAQHSLSNSRPPGQSRFSLSTSSYRPNVFQQATSVRPSAPYVSSSAPRQPNNSHYSPVTTSSSGTYRYPPHMMTSPPPHYFRQ